MGWNTKNQEIPIQTKSQNPKSRNIFPTNPLFLAWAGISWDFFVRAKGLQKSPQANPSDHLVRYLSD
jgi:hypothetical protein